MALSPLTPKVEPLSERTWRSIESRLFEELESRRSQQHPVNRRPSPGKVSLTVASLSLAASLFALVRVTYPGATTAPDPKGGEVAQRTLLPDTVTPEQALADSSNESARIVATHGPLERHLGESRLLIADQSALQVEGSDERGWQVSLERGSVSFHVTPRKSRPDFLVKTAGVLIRVVGTRFDVRSSERGTRVAVEEGRVLVEKNGTVVALGSGDSWSDLEEEEKPKPEAVEQAPPRRHVARSPRSHRAVPKAQEATRHPPLPAEEFQRAAALEVEAPARALEIYRRLAGSSSDWAAPALYARGRLLYDQHRVEEARSELKRYAAEYPNGLNALDVDQLLERIEQSE